MVSTGRGVPRDSRYARVAGLSRRSFLTAVGGAVTGLLAACARSDEEVFADLDGARRLESDTVSSTAGNATTSRPPGTLRVGETDSNDGDATSGDSSTAGSSSTGTTATESTPADTTPTTQSDTSAPAATADVGGGVAVASGRDLVISFTYQQLPGGKNVPPYIAVWIEDAGGNLVQTVALWYQQDGRGERWLPDLRRWFSVDQERITQGGIDSVDAMSGPTRQPGRYEVAWAGQVQDAGTATAGTYHLCIESARERGPYSLIREAVELNGSPLEAGLTSDNELVDASARVG